VKIVGLDGQEYAWRPRTNPSEKPSANHMRARQLLEKIFPFDQRLEEVWLPGTGGLEADFYIPPRKLLVEVHGEQHYQFVPHFHRHKLGFLKGRGRDNRKRRWCELNGITHVELPHDETDEQWTGRVLGPSGQDSEPV